MRQDALAGTKAALAREEGRTVAAARSRAALVAVWGANRRRGGAARTVQRAWRAWRVRGLLQQGRSAAQARAPTCIHRVVLGVPARNTLSRGLLAPALTAVCSERRLAG